LSDLLNRYWLAGAIVATVVVAVLLPGPARALPGTYAIDIGVVVIMFLGSLKLEPRRFKEAAARSHLVLLSLVAVFAISPVVSLGLGSLTGFDSQGDLLSVLICSAQASTLTTAIVLTEVAGGDVALAMVITVVNNIATVGLTPLVFRLLGGAEVDVDYPAMILGLALKIVAPVLAGQLARLWLREWAARHKRKLSVASQLIILMYIYAGVGAAMERLSETGPGLLGRVIGLATLLHAVMLVLSALIARVATRNPGSRAAFVFCSSQKTLPVAIMIWKSHFPLLMIGPLVAVAHHMLQLIADSVMAPGFLKLPLVRQRK
jgi:sodium/bile acid cotransporter 7